MEGEEGPLPRDHRQGGASRREGSTEGEQRPGAVSTIKGEEHPGAVSHHRGQGHRQPSPISLRAHVARQPFLGAGRLTAAETLVNHRDLIQGCKQRKCKVNVGLPEDAGDTNSL